MSQHATSDLDGTLLNQAVAIAAGMQWKIVTTPGGAQFIQTFRESNVGTPYWSIFSPRTCWDEAGPLLTAEEISLSSRTSPVHRHGGPNAGNGVSGCWSATTWHRGVNGSRSVEFHETSPLIAAMRCYVASRIGDTVELP